MKRKKVRLLKVTAVTYYNPKKEINKHSNNSKQSKMNKHNTLSEERDGKPPYERQHAHSWDSSNDSLAKHLLTSVKQRKTESGWNKKHPNRSVTTRKVILEEDQVLSLSLAPLWQCRLFMIQSIHDFKFYYTFRLAEIMEVKYIVSCNSHSHTGCLKRHR